MKKKGLLFFTILLSTFCSINAEEAADAKTSLGFYLTYTNGALHADSTERTAALAQANAQAQVAYESEDATDDVAALQTLRESFKQLIATAAARKPVAIVNTGGITSKDHWILGASEEGNNGNGAWYLGNRKKDQPLGLFMEKWVAGPKDPNYAYYPMTDLPAGSYSVSIFMANMEETEMIFGQTSNKIKTNYSGGASNFTYYLETPVDTLLCGIKEKKNNWTSFNNFSVIYYGADVMAPNIIKLDKLVASAEELATTLADTVPAGVITALLETVTNYKGATYATAEEFDAAYAALNAAMDAANSCIYCYADYLETVGLATQLQSTYTENAAALAAAVEKAQAAISATRNVEEIGAVINGMLQSIAEVGFQVASLDNPFTVYQSGEKLSLAGWATNGKADKKNSNNNWFISTRTSNPAGLYLEVSGTAKANFAHRKLAHAEAGTYTVSAIVVNTDSVQLDFNNQQKKYASRTAGDTLTCRFVLPEKIDTLAFGVNMFKSSAMAFKELTLTYYGQDMVATARYNLQLTIEEAEALHSSIEGLVPDIIFNNFGDLFIDIQSAFDTYETLEELQNAENTLRAAINDATACQKATATYIATYSSLVALLDTVPESESKEVLAEAISQADEQINNAASAEEINAINTMLEKAQAAYGMANASLTSPMAVYASGDITSLDGWVTGGQASKNNGSNNWYVTNRKQDPKGKFMEMWGSVKTNYAHRALTNMPVGIYDLSVFIAGLGNACELTFNGEKQKISAAYGGATAKASFVLMEPVDTLWIGVNVLDKAWIAFNNFTLTFYGSDITELYSQDLQSAINEARTTYDAAENIGDKYFQIHESARTAYKEAIDAAQFFHDTAGHSIEEIQAEVKKLDDALVAYQNDVVAPEPSDFFNVYNTISGLYLNLSDSVSLSETPTPVRFAKAEESGWYITTGAQYLGYATGSTWTLSTTEANMSAWRVVSQGTFYVIKGKNGHIGTDGYGAGSLCYGDKKATAETSVWALEKVDAPEGILPVVNTQEPTVIYDLMGRRVTTMEPGKMYIVNRKKIIVY